MTGIVERELHTYIDQLNPAQKKSLLGFIKSIFPLKQEIISMEEYNKELEDADASIERGEYYTHEQVIEITKKLISARK